MSGSLSNAEKQPRIAITSKCQWCHISIGQYHSFELCWWVQSVDSNEEADDNVYYCTLDLWYITAPLVPLAGIQWGITNVCSADGVILTSSSPFIVEESSFRCQIWKVAKQESFQPVRWTIRQRSAAKSNQFMTWKRTSSPFRWYLIGSVHCRKPSVNPHCAQGNPQ